MPTQAEYDRYSLPRDIVDETAYAPPRPEWEARGYSASHPAGRGWIPDWRDLGIPGDHEATRAPGTVVVGGVEHSFPFGLPEDVIAACGASAVFTVERRVRFLDNLAFKGNVRAAAAMVGVSHETAYRKRRQDAGFAALWDAAMVLARKYAESQLATRALDGIEVPVFHRGEIIAYQVKHDTRLLLAHLGRLDRRADGDAAARERAGRFDELLAEYAGHTAPEGFAEAREALPPTRAEYVAHRCGEALDALELDMFAGEEARIAAEAAALDTAGEAAGAEWDAWQAAALARVAAILEEGEGEPAAEGGDSADTPPLQGRGREWDLSAGGASPGSPDPSVAGDGPGGAGDDLPMEFKSAPPRNREGDRGAGRPPHVSRRWTVSQVSTPRSPAVTNWLWRGAAIAV